MGRGARALEPLLEGRLTQRVATLMARIEGEQHGHTGRVREWLARAVNAPRDPAWTADGVVSDRWAPVSPMSGALDAFRWRVPVEAVDAPAGALLSAKVEALVGLGAEADPALANPASSKPAAAFPPTETAVAIDAPSAVPAEAAREVAAPPAPAVVTVAPVREAAPPPKAVEPSPLAASVASDAVTKPARPPQAEAPDEDDLRERIRLAAQRAIAASNVPEPVAAEERACEDRSRKEDAGAAAASSAPDRRAQDLRAPARTRRPRPRAHRRRWPHGKPAQAGEDMKSSRPS